MPSPIHDDPPAHAEQPVKDVRAAHPVAAARRHQIDGAPLARVQMDGASAYRLLVAGPDPRRPEEVWRREAEAALAGIDEAERHRATGLQSKRRRLDPERLEQHVIA